MLAGYFVDDEGVNLDTFVKSSSLSNMVQSIIRARMYVLWDGGCVKPNKFTSFILY